MTNANHSGDATGDTALTLATVNSNVGSFTAADITVNAKGLITAAANGSGGSSDFKPYIASDSTGGQTMNSNVPFTVNLDAETMSDANYSLATDIITVSAAGTYQISFACTIDTTANLSTARDGWESYIEYNASGGGYVRVNQLSAAAYWREAADLNTTGTCSFLVVAAGGLLRLRAQYTTTATAAHPTVADRTHVSIMKIA